MSHWGGGGGVIKVHKKCHVLFSESYTHVYRLGKWLNWSIICLLSNQFSFVCKSNYFTSPMPCLEINQFCTMVSKMLVTVRRCWTSGWRFGFRLEHHQQQLGHSSSWRLNPDSRLEKHHLHRQSCFTSFFKWQCCNSFLNSYHLKIYLPYKLV